jgi:hypothetical protein
MNREELNTMFGINDKQLDNETESYEDGTWTGSLGPVIQGRPRLYNEDLETISFKLPKSRVRALDATAKRNGESRSQFLRQAVDDALLSSV